MQGNPEYIDRSSRPGIVSDVSNATSRQVHQRPQPSAPQSRILSLDVIRGIAVAGILLVNTPNLLRVDAYTAPGHPTLVRHLLDLFVQERFFPIFSFLFGISFAIVLTGAMQRSNHPRVVLLRRLIALLVLGVIHQFLQPGEALLPYALCGLVLLLPLSWLPRRWAPGICAVIGAVLLLGVLLTRSSGLGLVPGLIVLGYSVGLTDTVRRAETATRTNVVIVIGAAVLSTIGILLVEGNQELRADSRFPGGVGLIMAIGYCALALVLLRTPLRAVLSRVFVPLGRMALTNYVAATLVVILTAPVFRAVGVGPATDKSWWMMILGCAVILACQVVISSLWLKAFLYGPLEYVWRAVTWWKRPRFRRLDDQSQAAPETRR